MGWQTLSNGKLVEAAAKEFDVLLTTDRNMQFRTSLRGIDLAVVIANAGQSQLHDLIQIREEIVSATESAAPGEFSNVGRPQA